MIPRDSNRVVVIIGFFSIGYLCSTVSGFEHGFSCVGRPNAVSPPRLLGSVKAGRITLKFHCQGLSIKTPKEGLGLRNCTFNIPSRGIEGLFVGFSSPLD